MNGATGNDLVHAEEASYLLEANSGDGIDASSRSPSSSSSSSMMKKTVIAAALVTVTVFAILGMSSIQPSTFNSSSVAKSFTNLGILEGISNTLHFHAVDKANTVEVTDSPKPVGIQNKLPLVLLILLLAPIFSHHECNLFFSLVLPFPFYN